MNIISNYRTLKNQIPSLIEISGYKNEYIAEKIGISAAAFAAKKKRNSWNETEVEKIIETLTTPNEDVEEYMLLQLMKARENEERLSVQELKSMFKNES